MNFVFTPNRVRLATLAITILAHVLLLGVLVNFKFKPHAPVRQELDAEILFVKSEPPRSAMDQKTERSHTLLQSAGVTDKVAASMTAPPAPTAEEWAFAAKYTNKNSKGKPVQDPRSQKSSIRRPWKSVCVNYPKTLLRPKWLGTSEQWSARDGVDKA
jgi:hypothetical protein